MPKLMEFVSITVKRAGKELTEAIGTSGGVVRASVSAAAGRSGSYVCSGNNSGVRSQGCVGVVGIHSHSAVWRIASHVLIHHCENVLSGGLVVGEDSLRAEKTAFLAGIPVEFDSILGFVASVCEDPEGFEDSDST